MRDRPAARRSRDVAWRFVLRLAIVAVALARTRGTGAETQLLAWQLCLLAAAVCAGAAILLREAAGARELTHWDEALAFLALGTAVHAAG
ncbi:hypothetical protein [Roseomonas sp. BN140053]|uniref:hypothetical protein n=1 Tax=Roseomonas sp. BN140053 TaxID=3391898 RepID=UPI0039E742B5